MEATLDKLDELSSVALNLWPEHSLNDIRNVLEKYIKGDNTSAFMYLVDDKCVGLALVSLRHDYVEGCITSPIGYLEAICVNKEHRKNGIASKLCEECEDWSRNKGCIEFASDCELDNEASYNFHLSIGFVEANRIIHFVKKI